MIKVCGATSATDIDLLHASGVDLVGLWHATSGGRRELDIDALAALAARARATSWLEPVLVTFLAKPNELADVLELTGIRQVQLHAYQTPDFVARLRVTAPPSATVIKVLHLDGAVCMEERFVARYERAGVDVFLVDSVRGGNVGSTGRTLDASAAAALVGRFTVPFMLAGGLTPDNGDGFAALRNHPRYAGADFDTAARNDASSFDRTRVDAIVRAWQPTTTLHH